MPFLNSQVKNRMSGEKAGYCICPLDLTAPKGWENHPSHSSGLTPWHTLSNTLYKGTIFPSFGSKQGNLVLIFTSPCCSRIPNKGFLRFLAWAYQFVLIGDDKELWLILVTLLNVRLTLLRSFKVHHIEFFTIDTMLYCWSLELTHHTWL